MRGRPLINSFRTCSKTRIEGVSCRLQVGLRIRRYTAICYACYRRICRKPAQYLDTGQFGSEKTEPSFTTDSFFFITSSKSAESVIRLARYIFATRVPAAAVTQSPLRCVRPSRRKTLEERVGNSRGKKKRER